MAKKTWIYLGAAVAVLVIAYLMFRPSSNPLFGGGKPATSGTAATIDATGRAAGGIAKLWTAIFGDDSSEDDGFLSTNFSGEYYLDRDVS